MDKIHFAIRKTNETISIFGIKIPKVDEHWFILPPTLQDSALHVKLRKNASAIGVMNVITKPQEVRLKESDVLLRTYLDENDIFRFNNTYLELDHDEGIQTILKGEDGKKKTGKNVEKRIGELEKTRRKIERVRRTLRVARH